MEKTTKGEGGGHKIGKNGPTLFMEDPVGEMNSNLKSVDVNVPGQWLTKAKKE